MSPNHLQNEIILFNFMINIISSYNSQAMYLGFSVDLVGMGHAVTFSSFNRISRQKPGQHEVLKKSLFALYASPLSSFQLQPRISHSCISSGFISLS